MNSNELLKRIRDHKFYLENFCSVKTKEKGIQPFILNEAQKDFFNTLRRYNRIMILKCRQLGFSTATTAFFYVDTIMRPGITTALIGYNSDMVTELLDKIKTFYRTTPANMRPTVQYDSKYQMSFPAMDSKILVLPNTKDVGRGYTLNNCLVTELSAWEDADEKFAGLMESIPVGGRLVVESTPRGTGNLYHRMWASENEFVKKEYGWWWGRDIGYTEELMAQKKRTMGERMWAQEYGLEFLSSGRGVFDASVIRELRHKQLKVGDVNEPILNSQICNIVRKEEGWVIYREVEPSGLYVLGADVSEGVEGGDNSVATIWDRRTGEEVAMYRGLIPPDRFGDMLDRWGRKYNNALMAVEVNNHGLTTITILKQKIYPTLYFRPTKFEALSAGTSDRIGWKTTKVTRPLMIDELAQALREGNLIIHSKEILDEMSVFVYNDAGDMQPQPGFKDDCIFSSGIAFQAFKILYDKPLTQIDASKHLPINFAY